MAIYSTSPNVSRLGGPGGEKHIPFKVFIKVLPDFGFGRRAEYIRDLEKIADRVEVELLEAGINVQVPIAFTPQVGQAPARLTLDGWVEDSDDFTNASPVDNIPTIIHSGTVPGEKTSAQTRTMGTGDLSSGQDPTADIDQRVAELRNAIEVATAGIDGIDRIFYIEFNRVKYGSLPNKKAFRTLPIL